MTDAAPDSSVIPVNVQGLPPMTFPANTDPAVIQRTVKQMLAGVHPAQQQDNAQTTATPKPQAQQPTPATVPPPSPPQAPVKPPSPASGGDGLLNDINKTAQDYGNGAFAGVPDEVGAKIATGLEYAGGVLTPGKGRDLSDINAQNEKIRMARQSALQAWNDDHEGVNVASQLAGGLTTMGPLAKTIGAAASAVGKAIPEIPGVTSALQKFATAAPKTAKFAKTAGTVSATGAGIGALSAGAQAAPGDTEDAAEEGAGAGAGIGLLTKYAGEPLINAALDAVGPAIKGAKAGVSALQDYLRSSEEQAPAAAGATQGPTAPPQASNITGMPLGTTPPEGPPTGELPMPNAVRSNDREQLRVMEKASKGGLGTDAEQAVNASQQQVIQAAKGAAQAMKGANNNETGSNLVESAVQQFQDAGEAAHAQASALYKGPEGLNQAAATTILAKNRVGPSLGTALSNAVTDPQNVGLFNKTPGLPAPLGAKLYQSYNNMIKGTQGNELPAASLIAWRKTLSDAAMANPGTSESTAAGKLGQAFDDWMENGLEQKHVLSGDPSFAEKAQAAAQGWKAYKTAFPQRASPFMPGEAQPFEMTPADHAAKLMDKNGVPSKSAAMQVRGMVAALPTPEAQTQYRTNLFSGAIDMASKGLNGDVSSLTNYRNNLQNFRNSQLFREQFIPESQNNPDMQNKISIMDKLIPELNTYISNTTSRRIVSPSAGAINDLATQLAGGFAKLGVPLAGDVQKGMVQAIEHDTKQAEIGTLNNGLKAAAKTAAQRARSGPVFNIDSLKAGITGGLTAGNVVQQNNGGTK